MTPSLPGGTALPPFCSIGADLLPQGPPPGSPESEALAAWEVLTRARIARSTGSGRMSLLAAYHREGTRLSRDRLLWIALHPFEGAAERWACRLARRGGLGDKELIGAIVQEMGGPAGDPDEMTTMGFWLDDVGFHFDCRGPCLTVQTHRPGARPQRHRVGPTALTAAARRIVGVPRPPIDAGPRRPPVAPALPASLGPGGDPQLSLL